MPFFELRTPKDMLEKARREHERLVSDFNIDHLFNFFVTANHIRDYVYRSRLVSQQSLEEFMSNQDLRDCRDLCDQGKHLILTRRENPATSIWSGCIGGAPIGALPIGGGDKWVLLSEGREVDVQDLAQRVLDKWNNFFDIHHL
jgi:hypothetical protein